MGKVRKTIVKRKRKKHGNGNKKSKNNIMKKTRRQRKIQRGGFFNEGGMSLYQSLIIGLNDGMGTNQDLIPLIYKSAELN